MAKQSETFNKVTISTDQNNPIATKSVLTPPTANEVQCVMSSINGTWVNMMGPGILTFAIQQQLPDATWLNVVSSTFDAQSTNKDGRAVFSALIGGLGNKNLRLVGWCTTSITFNATITITF